MKFVPKSLTRQIGRKTLIIKKNSPTILLAAGVVGVVGSTVLACRSTMKMESVLTDMAKDQEDAHNLRESAPERYTDSDYKHDLTHIYVRSAAKIVKLYAPAIILGAVSIGCIVGSNRILEGRNATLMAAYAALEKSQKEYRKRVQGEVGEEKEAEFAKNSLQEDLEDEKAGRRRDSTTVKGRAYARFFDQSNQNWQTTRDFNMTFLELQQEFAQVKLASTGHLFLNEVYDALGLSRTAAGAVTGWLYDGDGDGYVSFGDFRRTTPFDDTILLDFNVDGVIYDKI